MTDDDLNRLEEVAETAMHESYDIVGNAKVRAFLVSSSPMTALSLIRELRQARAALEPFAAMLYSSHWPDDEPIAKDCREAPGAAPLTVGDFRRAKAALDSGDRRRA